MTDKEKRDRTKVGRKGSDICPTEIQGKSIRRSAKLHILTGKG